MYTSGIQGLILCECNISTGFLFGPSAFIEILIILLPEADNCNLIYVVFSPLYLVARNLINVDKATAIFSYSADFIQLLTSVRADKYFRLTSDN